jgi:signal transduction histidine kinase
MSAEQLRQRVLARDRLLVQAEAVSERLGEQVLGAFARGELEAAAVAAQEHQAQLGELTEHLRIYQAELHAQADELAASQARAEALARRFSTLFASAPVATLLVGPHGELLEHNLQAERLLQPQRRGASVRFLHRLVHPDDYQHRVRPAFHEALGSGASALEGVQFVAGDGRAFVGELHIAALPDPALEGAFSCAVIDRTESLLQMQTLRSQAEALRRSEAVLADSASLARIGGWELSLHPRVLRWSSELRALLEIDEHTPATLEATLALCAPRDRSALAAAVAAAERGTPFEIELDLRSARGRAMRMLAMGHADAAAGEVTRVSGVLQDITGQHRLRRELSDVTQRLAIANQAGGIGVWDWQPVDGGLVFDERMRQLLDLGQAQALAGTLDEALAPMLRADDARRLREALAASIAQGQPLQLELQRWVADGSERWLHLSGRAHTDAQGRVVRLIGCAWDSSPEHVALHLKAAKEAAESASLAKSAFLSRMSHELRTPLNAILGFSQLMRMEAEAGETTLKTHRVVLIETAARHLLDLVNEVLDVTRVESGRLELKLSAFDLCRLTAEALPMVQGLAEARGITMVDHSAGAPACTVLADRLRLKEVLINLLSNAVKYNVPQGRVEIEVRQSADAAELRVTDTGTGLNERQIAGLFQPFNRLGAEASGIEGSGMGLFVSRRFVELMGGRIHVDSLPGRGTTVHVRLQLPAAA